jgi:hypothetical protein
MTDDRALLPFEEEGTWPVRRQWHDGQWYLSIIDVVRVLTDSAAPLQYWRDQKKRMAGVEDWEETLAQCLSLKALSPDGKMRLTDFAAKDTLQVIKSYIPRHNRRRARSGHIYAIQATTGGLIKLGYARDVMARLGRIQTMCPVPLKVIWHKSGTSSDEQALHTHFAAQRQHGEWFDLQGLDIPGALDGVLTHHTLQESRAR